MLLRLHHHVFYNLLRENCYHNGRARDPLDPDWIDNIVDVPDHYGGNIRSIHLVNNENDEILILPHGEHQVDISQYIYEMLVLAVPSKRIHPGVADGSLKSDILDRLEALQPKEQKNETGTTDPRWDGLKKLLTDNK